MNSKRKKSARKPKVEALATVESQPTAVGLPHPEASLGAAGEYAVCFSPD
jgi:hypothetical protein